MNVPLHEDSMTDSSGSSDNDQVLFDIMESHDDNHNNIVCLSSMFVMECYDEDEAQYEYEHKWGGSPPGRIKKIERDFQDPSRSWRSNISMEKVPHTQKNSLKGDSVYQEWFLLKCGGRWRERGHSSSITIALRTNQGFILLFEWLHVGDG